MKICTTVFKTAGADIGKIQLEGKGNEKTPCDYWEMKPLLNRKFELQT